MMMSLSIGFYTIKFNHIHKDNKMLCIDALIGLLVAA